MLCAGFSGGSDKLRSGAGISLPGDQQLQGIPYGRAVRFHAPQPPQPWAEPLDASSYGCVCPLLSIDKPSGELRVPHRYWVQDEDCLNLNIWTPACDAQKRPVMVWLHAASVFCRLVH